MRYVCYNYYYLKLIIVFSINAFNAICVYKTTKTTTIIINFTAQGMALLPFIIPPAPVEYASQNDDRNN